MENDLFLAEVDDEGMLIDVEKGVSFFLNETGLFAYKMLKEGKNQTEIMALILDTYEVDEKEVEEDIKGFCSVLDQKGISWARKDM